MKKVVVIATGGTIAGSGKKGKSSSYVAGTINVEDVLSSIPNVSKLADIEMIQLMNVDSNEMNEEKWEHLLHTINSVASREDVDGIVITHGTDTIEETSYFLNLTVNTVKPVVLTGAMRPATATSADGPFNLYQSIALAINPQAIGAGVMCLFSSTIYSARDIAKKNNFKIDAFGHTGASALGYMRDEEVYFSMRPVRLHTTLSRFSTMSFPSLKKVAMAVYYAGASVEILEELARYHDGIVIIGTGSGNYSKSWLDKMNELSLKGIVFVRCSRVNEAIVYDENVFDPHNRFIGAMTLSPYKARILLMLSLSAQDDRERIRENFKEY